MIKRILAGILLFATLFSAHAADTKTQIDPTQVVKDPQGHAFLPCGKDEAADCAKDQTLGFFVYLALGAAQQHDPRAGPARPIPRRRCARRWAGGSDDAQTPIEISPRLNAS